MLGFVIGTVCLIGLIKVWRWGRWHRYGGHGWHGQHAWGGHGCHGAGGDDCGGRGGRRGPGGFFRDDAMGGGGFGGSIGRSSVMRAVFERLDTTPGQEKVIVGAVEQLREAAGSLRDEGKKSRNDLAQALRAPAFDEALFGEAFARHEATLGDLRKKVMDAFAKVHDALDDKQRDRLADLIESGPRFRGFGGPYRSA